MRKIVLLIGLLLLVGCQKEELFLRSNSSFTVSNVTALFVIDCSLPEIYENDTVEIVYGEAIYNNTNMIEIPFPEFCSRLEPEDDGLLFIGTPVYKFYNSSKEQSEIPNFEEDCEEVTCDCAKGPGPRCLAKCYSC